MYQRVSITFEGRAVGKKIVIFNDLSNSIAGDRKDANLEGVIK
jgi:hypothetical protein